MAELPKFASINEGVLMSELKSQFYVFKTKKTVALAYGFIFFFIAFTIFLAFGPSPNPASPWFSNIFSISPTTTASSGGITAAPTKPSSSVFFYGDDGGVQGSHISSIFSYFFPNSSSQQGSLSGSVSSPPTSIDGSKNSTASGESKNFSEESPVVNNQTHSELSDDKVGVLNQNQSTDSTPKPKPEPVAAVKNETVNTPPNSSSSSSSETLPDVINQTQSGELYNKGEVLKVNQTTPVGTVPNSSPAANSSLSSGTGEKRVEGKGVIQNLTSLVGKKSNGTSSSLKQQQQQQQQQGITEEDLIKSLVNCNLFDGNWVKDESYPLYKPGSCSLIDEQFNCFLNGRPDSNYHMLRWKPNGCTLPRLDGSHMLELLRGKRLVFVGDSLNRNMWESLICILRNSVKDQKKVYEASGRHHFRSEASYSFVFEDYKFTVEFFVSPFLVREFEYKNKDGTKKETLRLDLVGETAERYKTADIIIFNTGHWWTHDKTSLGKDYYQEGSHVYSELNVLEAFRRALTTWSRWVDANVDPKKSIVFFRGYSASHFSGGQWNSGGQCDHETEPIKNQTYLSEYPPKMIVLEKILKNMKTPVSYLNVTKLTDFRKDGHPSIYRKQQYTEEEKRSPLQFQDCSHWCLPGVPDTWNEILYAELLVRQYQKQQ